MGTVVSVQLDDFRDVVVHAGEEVPQVEETCTYTFGNGLGCISSEKHIMGCEFKQDLKGFRC